MTNFPTTKSMHIILVISTLGSTIVFRLKSIHRLNAQNLITSYEHVLLTVIGVDRFMKYIARALFIQIIDDFITLTLALKGPAAASRTQNTPNNLKQAGKPLIQPPQVQPSPNLHPQPPQILTQMLQTSLLLLSLKGELVQKYYGMQLAQRQSPMSRCLSLGNEQPEYSKQMICRIIAFCIDNLISFCSIFPLFNTQFSASNLPKSLRLLALDVFIRQNLRLGLPPHTQCLPIPLCTCCKQINCDRRSLNRFFSLYTP